MNVTYLGAGEYEVTLGSKTMTFKKEDVIALVEAVDKVDYFTDVDFPFFDFVFPIGE